MIDLWVTLKKSNSGKVRKWREEELIFRSRQSGQFLAEVYMGTTNQTLLY